MCIRDRIIIIGIMTFSDQPELHTPYTPVEDLQKQGVTSFEAAGMTNLGLVLQAAKDLIDDKDITVSGNYRPVVVLVSDGEPTDKNWRDALQAFISDGRSASCQRFAVAIGNDADQEKLLEFAEDKDHLFFAENAQDIVEKFRCVTMTVQRGSAARKTPEPAPEPTQAPAENPWM